jgi:hypothetical protein
MLESVRVKLKNRDFTSIARGVVEQAIGERPDGSVIHKSAAAVSRGRLGGLRGGKARALKLSAKQRKDYR